MQPYLQRRSEKSSTATCYLPAIRHTRETGFLKHCMEESLIRTKISDYFYYAFSYRSLLFCVFTDQLTTSFHWAHFSIYWQSNTYGYTQSKLTSPVQNRMIGRETVKLCSQNRLKLSSFFFCNKVCSTGVRKPWRELQNSEWGKDCGDTHDIICSIYELLYHFISKKYFPWILIRRQTCYTDKSKSLSISTICIDLIKHCNTEMKVLANRKEVDYPSFRSH